MLLKKIKSRSIIWSSNPSSRYMPKGNEINTSKKYLYSHFIMASFTVIITISIKGLSVPLDYRFLEEKEQVLYICVLWTMPCTWYVLNKLSLSILWFLLETTKAKLKDDQDQGHNCNRTIRIPKGSHFATWSCFSFPTRLSTEKRDSGQM